MICGTTVCCQGGKKKKKKQYVRKGKTEQENIVAVNVVSLYNNDATTMQQRYHNDATTYLTGRVWTQQVGDQQLMPPSFDDDGLVGRRGR